MIRTFYQWIQGGRRAVEGARRARPGRALHIEVLEHRVLLSVSLPWTASAARPAVDLDAREPTSEFQSKVVVGQGDRPASGARFTPVAVAHSPDSDSPDENVGTSAADPLEDEGGFIDLKAGTNRPRDGRNNLGLIKQTPGRDPPTTAGPPTLAPSDPSGVGSVSRTDNSWDSELAHPLGRFQIVTPIAPGEPAGQGVEEGWIDLQPVLSEHVRRRTSGLPDPGQVLPELTGDLYLASTREIGIDGVRGRSRAFELAALGNDVYGYEAVTDADTFDGLPAPGSAGLVQPVGPSEDVERVIAFPATESEGPRLQESAWNGADAAVPSASSQERPTATGPKTPPGPLAAASQAAADALACREALFAALGTASEDLGTPSDQSDTFPPIAAMAVFAAGIAGQHVVDRAWSAEDDRRLRLNPRSR